MRTDVSHIFAIGDTVGQLMLAHKAVQEAHVAAEVIACELQGNWELASAAFNARAIPSVAYTDPEVAWVRTYAGDMISEIALAVETGAYVVGIGKTIPQIRRWARALAWHMKWRMAVARICLQRASKLSADDESKR